jgi:hypothetical protein
MYGMTVPVVPYPFQFLCGCCDAPKGKQGERGKWPWHLIMMAAANRTQTSGVF